MLDPDSPAKFLFRGDIRETGDSDKFKSDVASPRSLNLVTGLYHVAKLVTASHLPWSTDHLSLFLVAPSTTWSSSASMKIQKAISPVPDIILGLANANIKNASTLPIKKEAPRKPLPKSLDSVSAPTQAGLAIDTATTIHKAYNTIPHPCLCLKTYAISYLAPLAQTTDAIEIEDDWIGVLIQLGASNQLVHAIVQPGMEEMMLCKSVWGWMKKAMTLRWESYEYMIELGNVREVGGRGPGEQVSEVGNDISA
ncbi:hypothetical protein E4T47_08957 [Aureobasidium subglaciale]|nr:hypothetical protein E4T47_08957 [Aureobasidium subglaciale]